MLLPRKPASETSCLFLRMHCPCRNPGGYGLIAPAASALWHWGGQTREGRVPVPGLGKQI